MEKFVLNETGMEVRVGDTFIIREKAYFMGMPIFIGDKITLTNENIPSLIKKGIIRVVKEAVPATTTLEFYIEKIANRLGWKIEKTGNYLNNIYSMLPAAVLSIVLREIAIELDKKYEDHIENSPEIYVISLFDGRITKANKAHIKNYRNFAAFRSIEDAKVACRIVKPILKEMFKSTSGK